jgi:hypothetical protein
MKQKSLFAEQCPHCTHHVDLDEQLEWSGSLFAIKFFGVLAVIAILILVDNLF